MSNLRLLPLHFKSYFYPNISDILFAKFRLFRITQ